MRKPTRQLPRADMAYWLMKQEPGEYAYSDLVRDGSTTWDGVTNALAQKHLRSMKPGDQAFFYHTGDEKAVVAVCRISSEPTPLDDKLVTITVTPGRLLNNPVSLATIKADKRFANWELVRNSRLSVMPCPAELWKAILELSKNGK